METRYDVIEKATLDCLDEMYRSSQPSITWEEVVKQSEENKNRRVWTEHYLPQHLYMKILEKYLSMYRIKEEWADNINVLAEYFREGGTKDKYIPERVDEHGNKHPGYRGYEKVEPIMIQFKNLLRSQGIECPEGIAISLSELVMQNIDDCKNFYIHNREEMGFRFDVSNYSPNSNINAVREFYKGTDIIINEIEDIEEEE